MACGSGSGDAAAFHDVFFNLQSKASCFRDPRKRGASVMPCSRVPNAGDGLCEVLDLPQVLVPRQWVRRQPLLTRSDTVTVHTLLLCSCPSEHRTGQGGKVSYDASRDYTYPSQEFSVKRVNLCCSVLLVYVWEGGISARLEEVSLLCKSYL